jgi:membrane dipeptidase
MTSLDPRRLHDDALVFDGHADTLLGIVDRGHGFDAAPAPAFHIDLPRMAAGGLDAEFFTAFVDPAFLSAPRARALALIEALHAQVARFGDRLALARNAAEVRAAVASGRHAAVAAIEGGHAIEDSLEHLRDFHARGVRLMTLTWNNSNHWADGCWPGPNDPKNGGLTDFGRKVIGEMERLGVIVDVSHAAPSTFRDVAAIATKPFVASHSGSAAVTPHFRNLEPTQLDAIARSGGLVGVCAVSAFLTDELGDWKRVMASAEYAALPDDQKSWQPFPSHGHAAEEALYDMRVRKATLDDFFAHLDDLVARIGWEHVGLGTDFDGTRRLPVGLEDCAALPKITEGLVARGYSEEAIRGILGGNWLRVLEAVTGG